MSIQNELDEISLEISECRLCDQVANGVIHAPPMNRGGGSWAMVIGVEPGNTEVDTGEAFSGLAGKRLFGWLKRAGVGITREEVQEKIYFTSLIKCKTKEGTSVKDCVANCIGFLHRQIDIIKPDVIITLGGEPFSLLLGANIRFAKFVGGQYREEEIAPTFFPRFGPDTVIVPLPHPSPRSTWLNSEENKKRLSEAIKILNGLINV